MVGLKKEVNLEVLYLKISYLKACIFNIHTLI